MAETQKTTTTKDANEPEGFAHLEDGQIEAMLSTHESKLRNLPDFKPPGSRAEAISLLVRAGIKPVARPPSTEQLREESKFEVRTPNPGFRGERFGINFLDGRGYTDNRDAALSCAECGYEVINAGTGKPAFAKATAAAGEKK